MRKWLILLMLASLSIAAIGGAGDLVKGLEHFLEEKGVKTDTDSLVAAVTTHPNSSVRIAASTLLGERGDKSVIPNLQRRISEETDENVRARVAITLLRLDASNGMATTMELMESSADEKVKLLLAGELARAKNYSGYYIVVGGLSQENAEIRQHSVTSLSGFLSQCSDPDPNLHPAPLDLLLKALADESDLVRWKAVLTVPPSCSNAKLADALARLAASDSDAQVREMAKLKLKTLRLGEE
jgi:HEAT repeat protein